MRGGVACLLLHYAPFIKKKIQTLENPKRNGNLEMAYQSCLKIGGWRPFGVIGFADSHAHARAQLSAFNWQKNATIL